MGTVIINNTLKCGLNMPLACVKRGENPLAHMLAPGPNTVDEAALGKILEGYDRKDRSSVKPNKVVAAWFDDGSLVNAGEGEAVGLSDSLGSLNVGDARKHISACTEPRILERWGSNESRKTVQTAISARLQALESGEDDPDEDED